MKRKVPNLSINSVCSPKLVVAGILIISSGLSQLHAQTHQVECDIRLNAVVSSSGNLSNDGKGTYYTGKDWVGVWLNPSRWPEQSFHICMNWPFGGFPECDSAMKQGPTGTRDSRTLVHRMTIPVLAGGKSLGIFTGPGGGNDIALSKPLTSTVNSFTDMAIGSSLSPLSAEVRFCNSDCSEYYSVIFGEHSVFGNVPFMVLVLNGRWLRERLNQPGRLVFLREQLEGCGTEHLKSRHQHSIIMKVALKLCGSNDK